MTLKELLLKLVNAGSEKEVSKIIREHPILSNPKNWRNYGSANNIGTVTGQAPEAVPSLVEKVTNSIDAILIKACREFGDDPESETSPKSMEEALKKYFELDEAKYVDLEEKKRRQLSEQVQVIADGTPQNPNIIIFDKGEGQHPQDFPKTFLSLGEKNKIKIFFVQGKFNMGGSAVLPFCGEDGETGYQLIVSKKNLFRDRNGKFGFALVRRNWGEDLHLKSSFYEYCVDENGKIFELESDPLDLGLYNCSFNGGTFIKLYSYDLPSRSDITLELWRDLNRYMYKTALPMLLYEKRDFKGHSATKLMHGNRFRALIDNRDNVETPLSMTIAAAGHKFPIEVFVFKKEVKTREFIKDMPVVFTVNGQVQHKIDKRLISSDAKKPYIKDSVLVNVDCSSLPRRLHERVFMSDRAHMRDIKEVRELLTNLAKELRDNEVLKEIDDQRAKDAVYQNPKDEAFLKKIMGKLLRDDKEIEALLGLKGILIGASSKKIEKKGAEKPMPFKGKRFPSIFRFKNIKPGQTKMLPQNGECKLEIDTDVENEYLMRPHDKGELKVYIRNPHVRSGRKRILRPGEPDEEPLDVTTVGPNNGSIKIRLKPNKEMPVGESVMVDVQLSVPGGELELTTEVRIDNPQNKEKSSDITSKEQYSFPPIIQVYKNKNGETEESTEGLVKCWDDYDPIWNENEICRIFESSKEGVLLDGVAINMDARELYNYIKSKKITGKNVERIKRTYKTTVYLMVLVLYNELLQRKNKKDQQADKYSNNEESYDPKEMVEFIINGMAKILLHVTTNEGLLQELDD